MTFCTLLLVGFVMMVGVLVQNGVVWCGYIVEKWIKWEVKRNFAKNDVFVNFE